MPSILFLGSIRKRLVVTVLFAFAPVFVFFVLWSMKAQREEVSLIEQRLVQCAENIADEQKLVTTATRQLLHTVTLLPQIKEKKRDECNIILSTILGANPIYGNMTLVDTDGNALAAGRPFVPANFSDMKHFRDALATKKFSVGEFTIGRTIQVPVLTFAQPVLGSDGNVTAVLTISILLDRYSNLFPDALFPPESYVGITDHKGVRIFRHPQNGQFKPGQPIAPRMFEEASRVGTGVAVQAGSDGIRRLTAFKEIKLGPDQPPYLYIFVGVPEDKITAASTMLAYKSLAAILGAVLIASLIAWFLGGRLVAGKIEELADSADRFGSGDFSAKPDISSLDGEFGVLASAFNNMADAIQARTRELVSTADDLRKSELYLRIISDNTYDWEYWRTPDGNYLWVSPAAERVTGYPAGLFAENGDAALRGMIHPEDRHIWAMHIKEVDNECPDHRELEFRIVKPSGKVAWIAHTCKPTYGSDGVFLGRRGCNRDITDRKRAEQAMAASLHEKEVLLREIHHRVKNNLQIISSLLSLQEQGLDDPAIQGVLAESRGRVTSMALIHEQLYLSHDLREIDVEGYLRQLIPRLVSSYRGNRNIATHLELSPVLLSLDQAIPFGLVVNELVTNSLKHGFRDSAHGTVFITASLEEGDVILVIEDDGTGLAKEFDLHAVTTLGLQIVTMLAEQLRGHLTVEPAVGARFKLRFPLNQPAPGQDQGEREAPPRV